MLEPVLERRGLSMNNPSKILLDYAKIRFELQEGAHETITDVSGAELGSV